MPRCGPTTRATTPEWAFRSWPIIRRASAPSSRVFLDSPALEAGLRKGDILSKVEDLDVTATNLQDAVDIMRGEVGKPVNVQVLRDGQLLDFVINRAQVHVNYVNSCMLENNVGYISLYEFSGDCSTAFKEHMNKLLDEGAKVLLIDLRDNPGGWVDDAVKVADLFLEDGTVASLALPGRQRGDLSAPQRQERYSAGGAGERKFRFRQRDPFRLPAGLRPCDHRRRDHLRQRRGAVRAAVGTRGAGMQLTVAQYFTPNGNEVHHKGITPDVIAEMPEENKDVMYDIGDMSDPQLKIAYDVAVEKLP